MPVWRGNQSIEFASKLHVEDVCQSVEVASDDLTVNKVKTMIWAKKLKYDIEGRHLKLHVCQFREV